MLLFFSLGFLLGSKQMQDGMSLILLPSCGTYSFLLDYVTQPHYEGICLVLWHLVMPGSIDITGRLLFSEREQRSDGSGEEEKGRLEGEEAAVRMYCMREE